MPSSTEQGRASGQDRRRSYPEPRYIPGPVIAGLREFILNPTYSEVSLLRPGPTLTTASTGPTLTPATPGDRIRLAAVQAFAAWNVAKLRGLE